MGILTKENVVDILENSTFRPFTHGYPHPFSLRTSHTRITDSSRRGLWIILLQQEVRPPVVTVQFGMQLVFRRLFYEDGKHRYKRN